MSELIIDGPACTLDVDAFRAWLDELEDGEPPTRAEELGVDEADPEHTADFTATLDDVIETLREDEGQKAFVFGEGVTLVDFIRTYNGEGDHPGSCSGLDVHVDLANGVRLRGVHQDLDELVRGNTDPADAVVAAFTVIADQANRAVLAYNGAVTREIELGVISSMWGDEGCPDHAFKPFEGDPTRCGTCSAVLDTPQHDNPRGTA